MGPFYVQSPFCMEPFLCTITFYALRIHPMLHPLYIKNTHNKIKQVTLQRDNFMYSAHLTAEITALGSTHST